LSRLTDEEDDRYSTDQQLEQDASLTRATNSVNPDNEPEIVPGIVWETSPMNLCSIDDSNCEVLYVQHRVFSKREARRGRPPEIVPSRVRSQPDRRLRDPDTVVSPRPLDSSDSSTVEAQPAAFDTAQQPTTIDPRLLDNMPNPGIFPHLWQAYQVPYPQAWDDDMMEERY